VEHDVDHDSHQAGEEPASKLEPTTQTSALRLVLGLVVSVASFAHQLPSRPVLVLAAFILLGALFWKAPPFDVGPHVRMFGGFVVATATRAGSAFRAAAEWAVGFGSWGIISGTLVGLLRARQPLIYDAFVGGVWGVVVGVAIGAAVWAGQQAGRDAEALRREKSG
jgi:hypothetical protein